MLFNKPSGADQDSEVERLRVDSDVSLSKANPAALECVCILMSVLQMLTNCPWV